MTVINTNSNSLVAQVAMSATEQKLSAAMEQLSTGLKINSAKDDAAGLAIVNQMSSKVLGLSQANQNANDAINLIQTAEGATSNITNIAQRMRQLALESANGTYTDDQRKDADLEFQQLKEQIVNIANQTTWNGLNIMNGTAGINIGEITAIKNTSDYIYTPGDSLPIMNSGDLVINGVNIGKSSASDDLVSPIDNAGASAIAKAAAINKLTNNTDGTPLTGVTAVVNTNVFTGVAMSDTKMISGEIIVNGYHTANISSIAKDASGSREAAIKAINSISDHTGVSAIDTGSDSTGITLVASDGRNIEINFDSQASNSDFSSAFGIKKGDQASTISLESNIKSPIKISSLQNGNVANTGFKVDNLTQNQSSYSTNSRSVSESNSTVESLQTGDLKINGIPIRSSTPADDKLSNTVALSSNPAASAIAIANAINSSTSLTGVAASANPATIIGNLTSTNSAANGLQNLFINGVAISINLTPNESVSNRLNNVLNAINQSASTTGVTATENSDMSGLTLASDGRNISTWFNSSINGLSASSFGLGSLGDVSQIDQISIQGNIPPNTISVTDNSQNNPPYIKYSSPTGADINFQSSSSPSTIANQISIVNNILYKGDGSTAYQIGTINSPNDGKNGNPLIFNLENVNLPSPNYFYDANNQVYYQYIPTTADWNTALTDAQSNTLFGNTGYLATITSENQDTSVINFLNQINAPDGIWLGGSDINSLGNFYWTDGPNKNEVFSEGFGGNITNGLVSTTQPNLIGNPGWNPWDPNPSNPQPDNADTYTTNSTNETSLEIWHTGNRNWNDLPANAQLPGYLVEYGGYSDSINPNFVSSSDLNNLTSLTSSPNNISTQASVDINGVNIQSAPSNTSLDATLNLESAIQAAINNGTLSNISVSINGSNLQISSTVPGTPFNISDVTFTGGNYFNAEINQITSNKSVQNPVTGIADATSSSNGSQTVYGSVKLTANNQTIPQTTDIESLQDIPIPKPPSTINISTGINGFNSNSQFTNLGFQVGSFGGPANSSFNSNQIGRLSFQVGSDENQTIDIDLPNFGSTGSVTSALTNDVNLPNTQKTVNIATQQNASNTLSIIDSVINNLSSYASVMGAKMNRLSYTSSNLTTDITNQTISKSSVLDTDYSTTSTDLAKYQIISAAANAVIAQANTNQQTVLKLLG